MTVVTLALTSNHDTRDVITVADITNLGDLLLGTPGYGQLVALVDKSDATNYTNIFGNKDTTNGRAVKIQYGDHAGSPVTLATFAKAAITVNLPATIKQVDLSDPASGYTSIGARAADGLPVFRVSGGSQTLLAAASDSPSTILTTTGDIIYASSGGVAARRAIGSTDHVLTVAGGVPTWAAGSKATLTTTGDLLYASAANTLARLAIGTARQNLQVNTGANGFAYAASLQSLMTAQGDILQASSANTPARLALGTARQTLAVNSGATALEYVASMQSLLTTQGDIIYASSANTPARLAKGTAGQALVMNSGATAPEWATNTVTRNQVTSAIGSTSGPTTTSSTYADLAEMTCTLTTTGGDLLVWFSGQIANSSNVSTTTFGFSLDGAAEVGEIAFSEDTANYAKPVSLVYRFAAPSSASHTVKVRWKTDAGTATAGGTRRTMMMMES